MHSEVPLQVTFSKHTWLKLRKNTPHCLINMLKQFTNLQSRKPSNRMKIIAAFEAVSAKEDIKQLRE
jgi:hypothetical protein